MEESRNAWEVEMADLLTGMEWSETCFRRSMADRDATRAAIQDLQGRIIATAPGPRELQRRADTAKKDSPIQPRRSTP
eukprot:734377-Heterocapsa_arctica.AAC.1